MTTDVVVTVVAAKDVEGEKHSLRVRGHRIVEVRPDTSEGYWQIASVRITAPQTPSLQEDL